MRKPRRGGSRPKNRGTPSLRLLLLLPSQTCHCTSGSRFAPVSLRRSSQFLQEFYYFLSRSEMQMSLLITHSLSLCLPSPPPTIQHRVFHKLCIIFSSFCTENSKHRLINLAHLTAAKRRSVSVSTVKTWTRRVFLFFVFTKLNTSKCRHTNTRMPGSTGMKGSTRMLGA